MSSKLHSQSDSVDSIIATRRSCQATGTGLSHYILVDSNKAEARLSNKISAPPVAK